MGKLYNSRKWKVLVLNLSICFIFYSLLMPSTSVAGYIYHDWYSEDHSDALIAVEYKKIATLPKKGGGTIDLPCNLSDGCIIQLKDFKKKSGKVVYSTISAASNSISDLQTLEGTIDKGFGRFEITTSGFESLFNNVTVTANLIESTGFTAIVGLPGDQLPQGGSLAYSTKWFSDKPIGKDPITGDEIILGEFFLDSAPPLEAFEYSLSPSLQVNFTIGEVYKFSSGFEIGGMVTKQLLAEIKFFTVAIKKDGIDLTWLTGTEVDNAGFRFWRATKNQYNNYEPTLLREFGNSKQISPKFDEDCSTKIQGQLKADNSNQLPKLISAIGNSAESTCYSFTDTSDLSDGTYYYLLEDIGDNGKNIFHCDQIDAVTVGQGPAIDLESAINYCKEVTGSNN